MVATLLLQHLLHHVCAGAAGNVFVEEDDAVGALEGLGDDAREIERQKRLHVDHLGFDSGAGQSVSGNLVRPGNRRHR